MTECHRRRFCVPGLALALLSTAVGLAQGQGTDPKATPAPPKDPAAVTLPPPIPLPPEAPAVPADAVIVPPPGGEAPPLRTAPLIGEGDDLSMGRMGGAGGFLDGPMSPRVRYGAMWLPDEPVRGQPTDLGVVRQDLSVSVPVWRDGPDGFGVSAHVRSEIINSDAVFPVSHIPLPGELWNIGFGGNYSHHFDNGWTGGASLSVGSASDQPFHGWDEMNVGLHAFLHVPEGERNAWLFSLSYSPAAQLSFPIPGVAFLWIPNDQLRVLVGLPFQVTYRPVDDLTIDLSYMLLTSIRGRVTYHCWGPIRVYAAYDWENEGYRPVDRPETRDRLISYDMRVSGGVLARLGSHLSVDLSSGYVFDRFYALGRSSALDASDRIEVESGPYVALGCTFRW